MQNLVEPLALAFLASLRGKANARIRAKLIDDQPIDRTRIGAVEGKKKGKDDLREHSLDVCELLCLETDLVGVSR